MDDASQPWEDPKSAWSVGIRRKIRKFKLLIAASVLVDLLFLSTIIYLLFRLSVLHSTIDSYFKLIVLLLILSIVLIPLKFAWMIKRECKISRLLSKTQGLLCPVCRVAMHSIEAENIECSRCKRSETVEAIVSYWKSYALYASSLAEWHLKYKAQGSRWLGRLRVEFARRLKENPHFLLVYYVGLFFTIVIVVSLFESRSLIGSMFEMAPFLLILGGIASLGFGYTKRKGTTKYCVACNYQQAPIGKVSQYCPECGADLSISGAIVQGEKIQSPKQYLIGISLLLLWALLHFNPFVGAFLKYNLLPTSSLIHDAANIIYDDHIWTELASRALSPSQMSTLVDGMIDQRINKKFMSTDGKTWLFSIANFTPEQAIRLTDALIDRQLKEEYVDGTETIWLFQKASITPEQALRLEEGILDQRINGGILSGACGKWLDARVIAGTMPANLVERYYEESFELILDGPKQARPGQKILVNLKGELQDTFTLSGLDHYAFLGDYFVNGQRIEGSRADEVGFVVLQGLGEKISFPWTVNGSGNIAITREAWIVITSTSLLGEIIWQDDHTPLIPPGVTWVKKITLQHDIEISE